MSKLKLGGGANAFAGKGNREYQNASPYSVTYRGKEFVVGDNWKFRVLSLNSKFVREITTREVSIRNPKDGSMMKIQVADQGARNKELTDHEGKTLDTCKTNVMFRMPVWLYSKTTGKGREEKVGELKFLEFGPGLMGSFNKLEEAQNGKCKFSEDTGRPEYDIRLNIVYNNKEIPKKYEFEPVVMNDDMERDAHFKVVAEDVLEDVFDGIAEKWEELQEAMDFGTDFEFVKNQVAVRQSKDDAKENAPSRTLSRSPRLQEEQESKPEAADDEEPTKPAAKTTKRFNLDED